MSVVLQFGSVFLGAFLAVVLENYREQRRLGRWVHDYLAQMFGAVAPELERADRVRAEFDTVLADAETWRGAAEPDVLDEQSWQRLGEVSQAASIDLSPVLRTEAITTVARPLAGALVTVEQSTRELEMASTRLAALHDRDILPLWYERRAPLTPAEARRVAKFEADLTALADQLDHVLDAIRRCQQIYASARPVSRWQVRWRGLWRPRSRPGKPPAPGGSPAPESR